ncbi:hypothetical protein PsorP6_011073 [Peronosclerospora sorghi]|uniref:Uncharacterized protein n=1 Tax=Peronosclerospora sorghi TaxID=230839 RepID=A0ACC0VWJ7_9STRA|nr:hypothetical protein PsorP6_011073 [Peronosclerospora sorghi]
MGKKKKPRDATFTGTAEQNVRCSKKIKATNLREIETLSFEDAFSAGLTFEQLESYEGAVASFQHAVKCEPKHLHALSHLADVYAAAEEPHKALIYYSKASELEDGSKDASIWFRLGLTYTALEQHVQATEAYEKAMNIHAHALQSAHEREREQWKAYGITLRALAEAFGERGDLDSAVRVYEEAVSKFPDAANMHYNLATMRMARRKSSGNGAFDAQVVQSLERAMELCPETPEFVNDLVAYLEEHKQQLDRVCILKKKVEEMERKQEKENERDSEEKAHPNGSQGEARQQGGKLNRENK